MRTPECSPVTRTGELRCGARTWPTDPLCDRTATWHIAWLLAPRGSFSLVCDTHLEGLATVYDYVDRHPAAAACDMPGTGWQTGCSPSRCVLAPTARPDTTGA